jgi:hypothetical protein
MGDFSLISDPQDARQMKLKGCLKSPMRVSNLTPKEFSKPQTSAILLLPDSLDNLRTPFSNML